MLRVLRTLQRTAADKILAFTELAFCDGEQMGTDKIDTVGQIVRSAEGTGEQGERGNVTGGQASRGVRVSLTLTIRRLKAFPDLYGVHFIQVRE